MKRFGLNWNLLVVAFLALMFASLASAQASRTWVSGVGDDANPCSRTAPCKTFAGAISKTVAGGEIDCLDPGGFGALTIVKAITIDCDGTYGSVLVAATNGIVVQAGANDVVKIRNVEFQGLLGGPSTPGVNGIRFLSGAMLQLDEVNIIGFSGNCLDIALSANAAVAVNDSSFTNCVNGVAVANGGTAQAKVDLQNVRIAKVSNAGIRADNGSRIVAVGSLISCGNFGGTTFGVQQGVASPAAGSTAFVSGGTISGCTTAFQSITGNFIGVAGSTLHNNGTIFNEGGGSISTTATSPGFGNTSKGSATGTSTALF